MCANYKQMSLFDFPEDFRAPMPEFGYPDETWPGYDAPIIMRSAKTDRVPARATFGMMPQWAKPTLARQTYNARSETVAVKPSFKVAWKRRQFCLIPVASFYEPRYEHGKSVRWSIARADGRPFALAGIWETRKEDDGLTRRSFSMLTINATDHPLMKNFHAPEDEKRSVVVLSPDNYDRWLDAKDEDDARELLQLMDAEEFTAEAAPLPARKKKTPAPE